MNAEANGDARFLKGAAVVLTLSLIAAAAFTYRRFKQKPYFAELNVERINIIEPDGLPRLILNNSSHTPAAIMYGKEHPHPNRPPRAGIFYFNDEGTENGGTLTFDMFDQDQVVSLAGGLRVWDQPYVPMQQLLERVNEARAAPEAERQRMMGEMSKEMLSQGVFTQRLTVGLSPDNASVIELGDRQRRPRVRAVVDAAGAARIDFLDEKGSVSRSIRPQESD